MEFGKALREAIQASPKRVGLIASCDWSHAHDENGPYGYDPAAKLLDAEVVDMIKQNKFESMANFDADFVEAAKPGWHLANPYFSGCNSTGGTSGGVFVI